MDSPQPQRSMSKPVASIVLFVIVLALVVGAYLLLRPEGTNTKNNNTAANSVANANVNSNITFNANTGSNGNTNAVQNVNSTTNANSKGNANINTTVDTSGWKTYTNTKYAYTFTYPPKYRVEEGDIYVNLFSDSTDNDSVIEDNELKVVVSIHKNISTDLASWISSFQIDARREQPFQINNDSAREIWGTSRQEGATFENHHIFYLKNSTGVDFSVIPTDTELVGIFYKIVESFKFT